MTRTDPNADVAFVTQFVNILLPLLYIFRELEKSLFTFKYI